MGKKSIKQIIREKRITDKKLNDFLFQMDKKRNPIQVHILENYLKDRSEDRRRSFLVDIESIGCASNAILHHTEEIAEFLNNYHDSIHSTIQEIQLTNGNGIYFPNQTDFLQFIVSMVFEYECTRLLYIFDNSTWNKTYKDWSFRM